MEPDRSIAFTARKRGIESIPVNRRPSATNIFSAVSTTTGTH